MPRRAFISLVLGVTGNVNADSGVGVRIPIKKVVTWNREVRAFVSPRCIRRGIRERLAEKGFRVDPLITQKGQLTDVGDPIIYVDDDLFGYLAPEKGKGEVQPSRSGPVKVSPLIALHHTEISVEFAGRFPRTDISDEAPEANPVPFEIETAKWLGGMHVIVNERVGRFREDELPKKVLQRIKDYSELVSKKDGYYELKEEERAARLRALLEILLREGWSFPRGSEAESIPEYHYAIVLLSESFIPTPNVLRMDEDLNLDLDAVNRALDLYSWDKGFIIDYRGGRLYKMGDKELELKGDSLDDVIEAVTSYLLRSQ